MTDFYADMADMVTDLLKPSPQGGLGQVGIVLVRRTIMPADKEWLDPVTNDKTETLRASAKTPDMDMFDGETILTGDIEVISAVPTEVDWRTKAADKAELFMLINGARKKVIASFQVPRAGTPVAIKYLVR